MLMPFGFLDLGASCELIHQNQCSGKKILSSMVVKSIGLRVGFFGFET